MMFKKNEVLSSFDKKKRKTFSNGKELNGLAVEAVELLKTLDDLQQFNELVTNLFNAKERIL